MAYNPRGLRTLVPLRDPADPQCRYQILRSPRTGDPTHDQYLPIPCIQMLSHCNPRAPQGYPRWCEGGQPVSFEEGRFIDVKVEFAHSKAVIGLDHSDNPLCSFVECTRCRRVSSKTRTTTSSQMLRTISTGCTSRRVALTKGLWLYRVCFRCDLTS